MIDVKSNHRPEDNHDIGIVAGNDAIEELACVIDLAAESFSERRRRPAALTRESSKLPVSDWGRARYA